MRGRNRVRGRTQRAQRDTQRAQENTRNGFCWAGMRGQIRRGRKGCAKDAKNTNMGFGWLVGWLVGLGWFGLVWFGLVWVGLGWVWFVLSASTLYSLTPVIPAQAGIHSSAQSKAWIPACAGMTVTRGRVGAWMTVTRCRVGAWMTGTSGRLCAGMPQSESACAAASATGKHRLRSKNQTCFCIFLRLLRTLCALCVLPPLPPAPAFPAPQLMPAALCGRRVAVALGWVLCRPGCCGR